LTAETQARNGVLRENLKAAVRRGDIADCRRWIALGADIDEIEEWEDGWGTLLHKAAARGMKRYCETLLKAGANWNVRMITGGTALHTAAGWSNAEVCEVLIKNGVNIEARDYDGNTALHSAVGPGSRVAVTSALLLRYGAHVSAKNDEGELPLHIAAAVDNVDVCRIPVAAGANPGEAPSESQLLTPFQTSVFKGALSSIEYLVLECGQDPLQLTTSGKSMLDLSVEGLKPREASELISALQVEWTVRGAIPEAADVPTRSRGNFSL
jgi:hypothetical protein